MAGPLGLEKKGVREGGDACECDYVPSTLGIAHISRKGRSSIGQPPTKVRGKYLSLI